MDYWKPLISKNSQTYKDVMLVLQDIAGFFLEKEQFADQSTGILAGKSGVALFLIYYYEFTNNEVYIRKALDIIKEFFSDFKGNVYEPDFSFEDGVAGIGWLINHIDELGAVDIKVESVFEDFYNIVYQHAIDNLSSGNHNLYNGSLGLINTLACSPAKNQHQLTDIVNKIDEVFHSQPDGLIQTSAGSNTTEKQTDLTLYSGLSGFLIILSKCIKQNINADKSKILCQRISRVIIDSYACNENEFVFVGADIDKTRYSASSWLTNDLGVIYSLIFYADAIGDDDLIEKSILILDKYNRDNSVALLYRDSLAAGNASQFLVYQLIHHITGKNKYGALAGYWLEQSLKTIKADGFCEYDLSGANWIKSYRSGLLRGLDGVGLALISSISSISPSWAKSIMLY